MARDLKYCHGCHNEFYNGDTCPRCGSDFIENFEGGNDPSVFYDDDYDDEHPASDPFSFASPTHMHIPPPNLRSQQAPSSNIPYRGPPAPINNPFGLPFHAGTPSLAQGGMRPGDSRQPTQPANPMFMDGYRTILEQLLGGLSQTNNVGHPPNYPPRYPTQQPPPQPQQQPPSSGTGGFQGLGHRLGTGTPQLPPQPQQQPQGPISHFRYSVTTYGPDGTVRSFSNSPRPGTPMAEGRQLVVPTLEDFLGMQMGATYPPPGSTERGGTTPTRPPERDDPYFTAAGPLSMLTQMLESVMPVHGNPGDYLRPGMTMDDLITQLMDQGRASTAPPPASTDAIDSLPRFKADKALVDGGKECTVCKENFTIGENSVRLPCLHVFHEDCILPWLKINGSCPVCRYTLNQISNNPGNPETSGSSSNNANNGQSASRDAPNDASRSSNADMESAVRSLLSNIPFFRRTSPATGGNGSNENPTTESSRRTRHDSLPPEEDLD